jgi:hypothetical protein
MVLLGDKSHTSSVPVIRWHVACPMTSTRPPMVASSATSVGELAMVTPVLPQWAMVLVLVTPSADGMSQGAASIEVDGAGPQLSDDIRGLLWDLVRRGASIDVPGSAAPGDAAPALGSSGIMGSGVTILPLPGFSNFQPAPID